MVNVVDLMKLQPQTEHRHVRRRYAENPELEVESRH